MSRGPCPVLSVVVPVYRTAWALPDLHRRVAQAAREAGLEAAHGHELIFVDDASPDGARGVAAELAAADPTVRLVALDSNLGQHRAVLAGLAAARGDWVVVMDGDLQDPPEAIPLLLAAARRGHDAVFAARTGRYQSPDRMLTSRLFKRLLARLCGLPRGAGMYFLASRRLVEELLRCDDPRPFVVAQVGLAGLPVTAVPVERARRPQGGSAYSSWRRLRAGLAAVAFAVRERRRRRPAASAVPPRCPRRLAAAIAAAAGVVSIAAGFAAGRGRVAGLTDEGFRYLLSRAWADGEPIHQVFQLLYVGGQYVYFGTFLRLFGSQLEVLRFAEQVLGGAAVAIVVLAVGRTAGPGLTAAAGAALAFLALPGFATVASALVLAAAVDLAARASDGGGIPAWWPFGAGLLAGLLAGWREDSAVLALVVALAAVALRRRPLDALGRVLPGVLLGFLVWMAIFAVRGEAADFVAHVGQRLGFLVGRLDEPNATSWRFPRDPFASRQALLAALFPFVAAAPPLLYATLLVREGLRWWRGGAVRWTSVAAAATSCAYLPQFLWEQPDHDHLWAHLHLLLGVAAIGVAGERLRWRRLAAAALVAAAIGGSAFLATRGEGVATVLYPCCEGRRIGARVEQPPPPWAGLARRSGDALLVLDWGAGWYVVEGLRPPTRFLHPGGRELTAEDDRELVADLLDPGVGWVITRGLGGVPPEATAALRRHYAVGERWRGWRLWHRLPV